MIDVIALHELIREATAFAGTAIEFYGWCSRIPEDWRKI
jgi:hypothetical protein